MLLFTRMSEPLFRMVGIRFKTVIFFVALNGFALSKDDNFVEELLIKPLPNGYVHANFHFSTLWNATISSASAQHYNLFPKAVGQIIDNYDVRELHLSLTQGLWRHDKWGYPVRSAPPGAELWAWFEESSSNSVDESWAKLVNSLSGLFCASLNFIDSTNTVQPSLSFIPTGVVNDLDATKTEFVRYATLPRENVCTENLTPWKKLLPCDSKAGLSALFSAIKLYNAHYHALTVDLQPICQSFPECTRTSLHLTQSISVVFKPTLTPGQRRWTLHSLFGNRLRSACPLASESFIHIDISNDSISDGYSLTPSPSVVTTSASGRRVASYNVADLTAGETSLNIHFTWDEEMSYGKTQPPMLHAHRFIAGYGQEKGGITCMIYNNHPSRALDVVYMESLPWYVRLYLHTLKIQSEDGTDIKPDIMKFTPGKDRDRPYLLELMISLPPASVITISIEFERAFLKWTEYPPDANIGFYLGSAVISAVLPSPTNASVGDYKTPSILSSLNTSSTSEYFTRIYTEPLLLQLPLPDFSMPYNVICLVCTVFAIAFGSIHNLTTRRLDFEKDSKQGLLSKLKSFLRFGKKKKTGSKKNNGEEAEEIPDKNKSDKSISQEGDRISKEGDISKEGASSDAGSTNEDEKSKKND